ncbi:hypothetical protein PQX77_012235 [Marasmius sp. AFHP31]|nr:hypothetical protein PQX77_012235 [Marasmius sp. AFHP31]
MLEGDSASDEAPPTVWEFNSKSLQRFPNSSNALTTLRKLGRPPSSFEISHPSRDNLLALSALVALGMRADRRHAAGSMVQNIQLLKRNWTATIDRWLRFLFDQVLLHDEGCGPSTPDGVDYFDISAGCANLLLSYPMQPGCDVELEFSELFSSSPYIPTSVARIWLRTVKTRHYSYKMWSQHVNLGSNAEGFHHALQTIHSQRDEDVVSVCMDFIRHDMEKIQVCRQLGLFHMADVLQVFTAMTVIHSSERPFFDLFSNRGIIQLLHDYLRTLYKKAKHILPLTDRFNASRSLIELVLRKFLSPFIVGPIPILEAAIGSGCGLLIYRLFDFLYRDSARAMGDTPASDPGSVFMAMISTHIIYPSILHQVLRHIPTLSRLEREGKLQSKTFIPFLAEWKRIVKKALYLKEVRRGAKERPLYLVCNNRQVSVVLLQRSGNSITQTVALSAKELAPQNVVFAHHVTCVAPDVWQQSTAREFVVYWIGNTAIGNSARSISRNGMLPVRSSPRSNPPGSWLTNLLGLRILQRITIRSSFAKFLTVIA